ncbi:MAG: hypothetical protein K2X48_19665 [Chitinophagaceae bacterium]|nr:hypothetical protein [Chitinophagaceae bacterium]
MKFYLFTLFFVLAAFTSMAQNIGNIKKQKPFKINGSIGASANFYSSNEPIATRPPFGWNIYGNFTPTVYGIALPVSFVINQYGKSYQQPFTMFGLSPTYKWAKLHLGYRTMQMSPLIFDGQSFRGVGLELNPKLIRFGAFYGKLNRKINEDTTSGRFALPQFSRIGYGIKLGVGNNKNFIDFIYFHAKDDSTSAKVINKTNLRSQENTVLGSAFKITLLKKITWTTDAAISGLTQDLADAKIKTPASGSLEKLFGKLMPYRNSTIASYAGQSSVSIAIKGYTTNIGYRRVQPDFKSLGTPYMLNDVELINWMNNLNLSKGKLNITASISNQHNNLKKNLTSELQTFVSSMNINAMLSKSLMLNMNYSGYNLKQKDGTIKLKDSVRLNQQIHQFGVMPSYTMINTAQSHTISGSINYMLLDDKNPATQKFTNSNNLSGSLNYTIGFLKKSVNCTVTGLFSQYKQDTNTYKTYGINLGSSAQLLKQKQLSLQGTAGYLLNRSSLGKVQNNLTFSGSAGFRQKHHSLRIFANYVFTPYNPINDIINKKITQAVASKNLAGGISYNYSF